ncbi:hypothetical protein KIW84_020533 [Lathyrus oleraceus]|uniref:Uncharacterized protein n=1 Tax=Pisum sativum TaxID=3888 RepID=A0A9D4Y9D8_PEA|nr:hypothetical protein KIW84_020533 [Pisum sativum]
MLHYFIAYILMPKHSNHYQINDTEMQIIYAVKKKLQGNWAYVIMHHMFHQKKLSYARLVTKIIQFCQINLHGESRFKMIAKEHEINIWASNKNLEIFKDKDGIFKHKEVVSYAATLLPEGSVSNEILYEKMHSIENLFRTGFRDRHLEIANIKQNQNLEDSG